MLEVLWPVHISTPWRWELSLNRTSLLHYLVEQDLHRNWWGTTWIAPNAGTCLLRFKYAIWSCSDAWPRRRHFGLNTMTSWRGSMRPTERFERIRSRRHRPFELVTMLRAFTIYEWMQVMHYSARYYVYAWVNESDFFLLGSLVRKLARVNLLYLKSI